MLNKLKRFSIFLYYKVLRMRGAPEEIARGLALGVFIGMTPTMGFQMAIGAFIATLLKQNIIATALAVWVTNPFTFIPIYTFNYAVGRLILRGKGWELSSHRAFSSMKGLFGMGWEFFYTLWFGSLISGILASIFTYYFFVPVLRKYQEKRRTQRKKRRDHKIKKQMEKHEASK